MATIDAIVRSGTSFREVITTVMTKLSDPNCRDGRIDAMAALKDHPYSLLYKFIENENNAPENSIDVDCTYVLRCRSVGSAATGGVC